MKITLTQLKIYLDDSSKKILESDLRELFTKFPQVKEFYQSKLVVAGNDELLDKYKKIIKKEFFPDRGFGRARLSVARKSVNDFKKLCRDANLIADLMVFYVEMGVRFTLEYGDIDEPFYYSMESMYDSAAKFAADNQIAQKYLSRFNKILDDTRGLGWGFHDALDEIYHQYLNKK